MCNIAMPSSNIINTKTLKQTGTNQIESYIIKIILDGNQVVMKPALLQGW